MALQLVIEDLEGSTTVVPLGEVPITIGRREGNTIQLTEQNVSRDHARLVLTDDGWQIEDLGSYNGVLVNAVPIQGRVSLAEGDQILIGDYQLALLDDDDRRTVDLGAGLRAANADMAITHTEPAMVPTGPIATLPPQSSAAAEHDEEELRGGAGWLIAGLLAVVVIAGGTWVAFQQGLIPGMGPGTKPAGENLAQKGKTEGSSEGTQPAGDDGAGVAATGNDGGATGQPTSAGATGDTTGIPAAETGAADTNADDGGSDSSGDGETTGAGTQPGSDSGGTLPTPVPDAPVEGAKKTGKTPAKTPMSDEEAADLLQQAQDVALSDPAKAYALAKKSYDGKKSSKALMIMGTAACKQKWADKAKAAQKKMGESDASKLATLCSNYGIELSTGE